MVLHDIVNTCGMYLIVYGLFALYEFLISIWSGGAMPLAHVAWMKNYRSC